MGKPTVRFFGTGRQMVAFRLQYAVKPGPPPVYESIVCAVFTEDLVPYAKRIYRGQRLLVAGRLDRKEYVVKEGKNKGEKRISQSVIVEFMQTMVPLSLFGIEPDPEPGAERPPKEWEINEHPDVYL